MAPWELAQRLHVLTRVTPNDESGVKKHRKNQDPDDSFDNWVFHTPISDQHTKGR
jgi:hypothetical protein